MIERSTVTARMDTENIGLFRRQAIEYATGKLYGDILVRPKPSHLILTSTCVLWVLPLAYLPYPAEWTQEETINGIVELDSTGSRFVGAFYVPVRARRYLDTGQVFTARIEGAPQLYVLPIRIEHISDQVIETCPVCIGEETKPQPYVQLVASLQGDKIASDGGHLILNPGVRLSFVLPTEKKSARTWLPTK